MWKTWRKWLKGDGQLENEILTDEEIITTVLHTEQDCKEDLKDSEVEEK